jgi:DNA-binding NarL/FixJ family response regulator
MVESFGRQRTNSSIAIPKHQRNACEVHALSMLLLEDDFKTRQRILSAIRTTPTEVKCVPTLTEALDSLDDDLFDIILIDRHSGGWISPQSCKALVARAGGRPVIGLIDEDCVLDLRDGIEAGLTAVYYKDEMSFHLMRRLARLVVLPSLATTLVDAVPPQLGSARHRVRAPGLKESFE